MVFTLLSFGLNIKSLFLIETLTLYCVDVMVCTLSKKQWEVTYKLCPYIAQNLTYMLLHLNCWSTLPYQAKIKHKQSPKGKYQMSSLQSEKTKSQKGFSKVPGQGRK